MAQLRLEVCVQSVGCLAIAHNLRQHPQGRQLSQRCAKLGAAVGRGPAVDENCSRQPTRRVVLGTGNSCAHATSQCRRACLACVEGARRARKAEQGVAGKRREGAEDGHNGVWLCKQSF
jgi:hypothetical protein